MEDGHHILVVDDHRDIRDPLAAYLKKRGFRVTTAADSLAARDMLLRNSIDLVVLDIMMPGENGLALCRELPAGTATPVIFLTAELSDQKIESAQEAGLFGWIKKPYRAEIFYSQIESAFRSH